MRFTASILAGAALVSFAGAAGAQDKKKEDDRDRSIRMTPRSSCTINGEKVECTSFRARLDSTLEKRAALGVQVSSTGSLRDTLGVFIARVTPKGPAETAGIVEGDRIVSINGVDLRLNSADAGDSYASSLASRRLTRELQKLAPGNRVSLKVWSGGRVRDVQVTAGKASDVREGGAFGMLEGMPRVFTFGDRPWGTMELRSLPRVRTWTGPRMKIDGLRKFQLEDMPMLRFEDMPGFEYDDLDDDAKIKLEKKKSGEKQIRI
jgi:membrane-associated protease RseP (regulator of RpoE activity)